jgi:uncharacterized protein YndB with AHSA1/START domain
VKEHFDCPPERLFRALIDVDRAGEWMPDFVGMEKLTAGEFGQGTRFRETRRFQGKVTVEQFEVTLFEPPRRLDLYADGTKGSSGRGAFRFSYELAPSETGTDLTLHIEAIGMSLFFRLLSPLFVLVFKRILARDHAALRAFIASSL